jgi:hypothetical protein
MISFLGNCPVHNALALRMSYLISKKVRDEAKGGPIKVRVYKGLFDVTPDPKDLDCCARNQKGYEAGHFISYDDYHITEAQYKDRDFWRIVTEQRSRDHSPKRKEKEKKEPQEVHKKSKSQSNPIRHKKKEEARKKEKPSKREDKSLVTS